MTKEDDYGPWCGPMWRQWNDPHPCELFSGPKPVGYVAKDLWEATIAEMEASGVYETTTQQERAEQEVFRKIYDRLKSEAIAAYNARGQQ